MGDREKVDFNILFVTEENPFYVRLFFEEFFERYEKLREVKGIVVCKPLGKRTRKELVVQALNFYGLLDFARMGVKYGALKALEHLPAWCNGGRCFSLDRLCRRYGIDVIRESNIHSEHMLEKIRRMDLDLIVSVAAPVIFRKKLLDIARLGCINIHSSKLPQYRGMMPNFWQLYHGEMLAGITIHEMNEKIDEGRIILQRELDILPGETLDSLIKRSKRLGAELMVEALMRLRSGSVSYQGNRVEEGSYYSFPSREDVKGFRRRGGRIM